MTVDQLLAGFEFPGRPVVGQLLALACQALLSNQDAPADHLYRLADATDELRRMIDAGRHPLAAARLRLIGEAARATASARA